MSGVKWPPSKSKAVSKCCLLAFGTFAWVDIGHYAGWICPAFCGPALAGNLSLHQLEAKVINLLKQFGGMASSGAQAFSLRASWLCGLSWPLLYPMLSTVSCYHMEQFETARDRLKFWEEAGVEHPACSGWMRLRKPYLYHLQTALCHGCEWEMLLVLPAV